MVRIPVTSATTEARLESTFNQFGVTSNEDRNLLKNSLLRLHPIGEQQPEFRTKSLGQGVQYHPKDEQTAALLAMYRCCETTNKLHSLTPIINN